MYKSYWSTEQLESVLFQRYGVGMGKEGGAARPDGEGVLFDFRDFDAVEAPEDLAGFVEHLTGLLENQALFRAEIDSLRSEICQLKLEQQEQETLYTTRIRGLQEELSTVQLQRAELVEQFLSSLHSTLDTDMQPTPPEQFLYLPLVIKSNQNEYLGVTGKTRHFNLKEFISIIQRNASGQKTVDLSWRRSGVHWILTITTRHINTSQQHEHIVDVMQTVTPKQNKVVLLVNLTIDNNPVSDSLLLALFKKIKDDFDQ